MIYVLVLVSSMPLCTSTGSLCLHYTIQEMDAINNEHLCLRPTGDHCTTKLDANMHSKQLSEHIHVYSDLAVIYIYATTFYPHAMFPCVYGP